MIAIDVTIHNDRVVIADIERIHRQYPGAVSNALGTIVKGVNKIAHDENLSGSGSSPAGSYPVPVRKGHLRRSENIVLPGKTKSAGGKTYTAGSLQAIAYNAAAYAAQIHKDRPYLTDAVDKYGADRMLKALDTEVEKIMR